MSPDLRLRPLRPGDEAEARRAHAELEADDWSFLLMWDQSESWSAYLARMEDVRLRRDVPDDLVPATVLVATVQGRIAHVPPTRPHIPPVQPVSS